MNYLELGIIVSNDRRRRRTSPAGPRRGISQADYAEAVGISRNYLSMIELGKVNNLSVEILVRLAAQMRVGPTYLLSVLLERPEPAAIVPHTRWA